MYELEIEGPLLPLRRLQTKRQKVDMEGRKFTCFTSLPLEVQWTILRKDIFTCTAAVRTCKKFWKNREQLVNGCDTKAIVPDFITVPEIRRTFVQLKYNKGKISLKGPGKEHTLNILDATVPWKIKKGRDFPVDSQYWLILMMIHRFRSEEFVQVAINLCQNYNVRGGCKRGPGYIPNIPGLPEMPKPAQDMKWFLGSWAAPLLGDVGNITEYQEAYNDTNVWSVELACEYGNITFIRALIPDYSTLLVMVNCSRDPSKRWAEFKGLNKWIRDARTHASSLVIANSPQCRWMFSGTIGEVGSYLSSMFATGMTVEQFDF